MVKFLFDFVQSFIIIYYKQKLGGPYYGYY